MVCSRHRSTHQRRYPSRRHYGPARSCDRSVCPWALRLHVSHQPLRLGLFDPRRFDLPPPTANWEYRRRPYFSTRWSISYAATSTTSVPIQCKRTTWNPMDHRWSSRYSRTPSWLLRLVRSSSDASTPSYRTSRYCTIRKIQIEGL